MSGWIEELATLGRDGEDAVLVTITGVRGSAPREPGTRMMVTRRESIGTIGGGALEYQCTRIACEQLAADGDTLSNTSPRRFVLGANCGQCCGGVVDVQFEFVAARSAWPRALRAHLDSGEAGVYVSSPGQPADKYVVTGTSCESIDGDRQCPASVVAAAHALIAAGGGVQLHDGYLLEPVRPCDFNIAVFGAGHVGTEVVTLLSRLDCNVRWIDTRRGLFPRTVPANVAPIETRDPAREVAALPAGSFYLVMTHSHPLDLDITARILARGDSAYCGLIGSASKRRRFEKQLVKQGLAPATLQQLTCPIGVPGITSKKPAAIAFAVVAEILQQRDAAAELPIPAAPALRPVG